MMSGDGTMGFGGGFMWIFWILIIVLVVWVIKAVAAPGNSGVINNESPQEILKKRFARGEIDKHEYERRSKELEK